MLLRDTVLAYLHFISILATASVLVAEAALCMPGLDEKRLRVLSRLDLWYLFIALATLASGFSRAIWGAKGWSFYAHNPIFWVKISLFVVVGLISIVPTLRFIRWSKEMNTAPTPTVQENEVRSMSRYIRAELIVLAFIPLMATLMARGFGY
ncbi:MAG: DUF2214 family protein [Caldilineaceae bacterium]